MFFAGHNFCRQRSRLCRDSLEYSECRRLHSNDTGILAGSFIFARPIIDDNMFLRLELAKPLNRYCRTENY